MLGIMNGYKELSKVKNLGGCIDAINLSTNNAIRKVASDLWESSNVLMERLENAIALLYYNVGCSAYYCTADYRVGRLKIQKNMDKKYLVFATHGMSRAVCLDNLEVIEEWNM